VFNAATPSRALCETRFSSMKKGVENRQGLILALVFLIAAFTLSV
jgi:hypothetical protein